MKLIRRLVPTIVALFLSLLLVATALAVYTTTGDTYVDRDNAGTNYATNSQLVAGSTAVSGLDTCDRVDQIVYLEFDLSAVSGEIDGNSSLQINSIGAFGAGNVNVYGLADDTLWDPTTIDWTTAPIKDTLLSEPVLASVTNPNPAGELLSFSDAALNDFLNDQTSFTGGGDLVSGDDVATLLLGVSNCGAGMTVFFDSSEAGNAPQLDLYDPTAVRVQTISANQGSSGPDTTTLIIAGLGLLTVILIAMIGLRRRKIAV